MVCRRKNAGPAGGVSAILRRREKCPQRESNSCFSLERAFSRFLIFRREARIFAVSRRETECIRLHRFTSVDARFCRQVAQIWHKSGGDFPCERSIPAATLYHVLPETPGSLVLGFGEITGGHMTRQDVASMQVEEFRILAWKDKCGLLRLIVRNANSGRVACGLNHPWECGADDSVRLVITSNRYIIEDIMECSSPDRRTSPEFLRTAGKDATYRTWCMTQSSSGGHTPEELASMIEAVRREERRDPETGICIGTGGRRPHCALCQSGDTVIQPGDWVICKKCGFRRRRIGAAAAMVSA